MNERLEEIRLAEAFDHIDEDDSGLLSTKDLRKFLGRNTMTTVEKIVKEGDADGDGMISFDEFLVMFRNGHCRVSSSATAPLADLSSSLMTRQVGTRCLLGPKN